MAFAILAHVHDAGAQQVGNMPRIGFLASGSAQTDAVFAHAFREGLRERGWWRARHRHRVPLGAGRAIGSPSLRPTWSGSGGDAVRDEHPPVVAVKQMERRSPLLGGVSEPIEIGAVASLARAGGQLHRLDYERP